MVLKDQQNTQPTPQATTPLELLDDMCAGDELQRSCSNYTVFLHTLGCAKNEVDSRTMRAHLTQQGFRIGESPHDADFIILNTCAFIEAAIEESLDTIFELTTLERVKNGKAQLLVVGCLPSRYGEKLVQELPEVRAFVPVTEEAKLSQILNGLIEQIDTVQADKKKIDTGQEDIEQADVQPWAYVKISDGCSRHCSYCTIPLIRGAYHSYPYEQILAEIDELVISGAREIVLIGQDTGIWCEPSASGLSQNSDTSALKPLLGAPNNLAELLDALAIRYPQVWLRIMYLQPEGITDELLEVMATHENVASYLDIPLQHASAKVLRKMNRRGSGKEYLQLIRRVREILPQVVLRTTVMTGFPGETEEDFNELCSFIGNARFEYVGIFTYSCEEGTVAASLPKQVDKEIALERAQILRDIADNVGIELALDKVGEKTQILVCGRDEEGLFGRTQGQAPEVDGQTYLLEFDGTHTDIPSIETPEQGNVINARITEAVLYDLFAEVL